MATQFKHIDFPAAQAPSRAPNAALAAVTQAFGGMPEQTLDEVAEQPQQLDLATWDAALAKAEAAIAARDAHWEAHIEPLLGDAEVELRNQPDWQAYRPLSEAAARAAVELAALTPPSPNGFILAVRLLCETAQIGVEGSIAGAGEAVVDAIKRHAEDLLENASAPAPYMGGLLAHWRRLYENVLEDQREMRSYRDGTLNAAQQRFDAAAEGDQEAAYAELSAAEDEFDVLVASYDDSRIRLYLTPAPSPAEIALKLKLIEEERDWDLARIAEVMKHLAIDARRFGRLGAFIQGDAELLSAFAECRGGTEQWLAADPDLDEASSEEADAALRAAEDRIFAARATTIEGVLAKLRLAFKGDVGQAWSDRAIADTSHVVFRDGLASGDWYTRLLWGAIDDLAKLGGVDLATMGADPSHGQPASSAQARPAATVGPKPPVQLRPEAEGAGLRSILAERNAVLHQLGAPGLSDAESEVVGQDLMEVERRLIDTPAVTADDMMAKLLLIAQIAEEGHEAEEDLAAKVLAEARALGFAQAPARGEAA